MGIVDAVEIGPDGVEVRLLPTFPGCIYTAVFAGEILQRLGALDWTDEISVELAEDECVWDETRMSSEARERLRRLRRERIRRGLVAVRGR
jgi:metal-sulfur cluster biosynthetic enzyme